jgi:hypothetical protein
MKKEERALFKNRISAAAKRKREPKNDPIKERGERMYVLPCMFVTFSTFQVERLPLKAPAPKNTAP